MSMRRKKTSQGFSVVELIVSLVLFSLMVTALVMIITSVQTSQRIINYLDTAKNAAVSYTEQLRNSSDGLTDGQINFTSSLPTSMPSGSQAIATIAPAAHDSEMKNVNVKITFTYPAGGLERKVEINSVVGKNGIMK